MVLLRRMYRAMLALLCAAASFGCGSSEVHSPSAPDAPSVPRIAAFGDSLTAGFGLQPSEAYPALLQQRLDAAGLRFEVVNEGVSGDTSEDGRNRMGRVLAARPRILILAFGANDGLRGLPVDEMKANL